MTVENYCLNTRAKKLKFFELFRLLIFSILAGFHLAHAAMISRCLPDIFLRSPRSCSMLCWRMLAVSKELGCLLWIAQAEMLEICLIV